MTLLLHNVTKRFALVGDITDDNVQIQQKANFEFRKTFLFRGASKMVFD